MQHLHRRVVLRLFACSLVLVLAAGCSDDDSPMGSGGASTGNGAGGADGTTSGATGGVGAATGGEGGAPSIPVDLSCDPGPYEACETTYPLPTEVRTIVDLTDPDRVVGRCDSDMDTWDSDSHTVLPNDPDAYPLLVRVSAEGFDGECSYCEQGGVTTTYGVAMALPYELWAQSGETAILAVNEPWSIVSGGCGETCAIPCLDGYQEFTPGTCLGSYARDFGVATNVENPPVAELLVALTDNIPLPCCPWQCER